MWPFRKREKPPERKFGDLNADGTMVWAHGPWYGFELGYVGCWEPTEATQARWDAEIRAKQLNIIEENEYARERGKMRARLGQ